MTERSVLTNSTVALAAGAAAMASSGAAAQVGSGTDWGGFYVGGNAGVNFLHSDPGGSTDQVLGGGAGYGGVPLAAPETVGTSNGSGALVGGQGGFNWQQAQWVYGGELGFQWLGDNTTSTRGNMPFGYTKGGGTYGYSGSTVRSSKAEGLFTMRARIGEDFNGTLPYVIGGFALAQVKSTWTFSSPGGVGYGNGQSGAKTSWLPGFAIGAGIEQKLGPNWSVRGEFSWMQFQTQKLATPVHAAYAAGAGQAAFKSSISTVTLGLNYRF